MIKKIINNLKLFFKTNKKGYVITLLLISVTLITLNIFLKSLVINILLLATLLLIFSLIISVKVKIKKIKNKNKLKPDQLEIVTKNMEEGVIIYTPDFRIININPAAEKLLNIKKEDIINKKISPNFVNNKKLKSLTQIIFPSLAPKVIQLSDKNWPQITEITTDNNLNLITTLSKTTNNKNKSTSFIKIIQDKTNEKKLIKNKTEFITNSAHQLRQPLESINKIFKNIINNDFKIDKNNIIQGKKISQKALKTLNNLLKVSRFEGNKYEYNFENIDIIKIIKKAKEEAEIIAKEYNIKISLETPESLYVKADKNKIANVISTLIDNAIKYNNEGGYINITIEKSGNFAEITISDTGIGIKRENLEKIFKRFYRTERGKKQVPNGSGFGLYITKKIINKHGGEIWVDSILKRGSNFHFTLPLNK